MNKASGGNGIPVEIFKIPKDDVVTVLHSVCQQIWKTQQWLQNRERFSFQFQRRAMSENVQTTIQLLSFPMRQLEPDIKQLTGSKFGKEYDKAVYCHSAYLTFMQSTSCKMPGWMKCKLESRLLGEISITLDMWMIPPLWQKEKRN